MTGEDQKKIAEAMYPEQKKTDAWKVNFGASMKHADPAVTDMVSEAVDERQVRSVAKRPMWEPTINESVCVANKDDLREFLTKISLGHYYQSFAEEGYTTVTALEKDGLESLLGMCEDFEMTGEDQKKIAEAMYPEQKES